MYANAPSPPVAPGRVKGSMSPPARYSWSEMAAVPKLGWLSAWVSTVIVNSKVATSPLASTAVMM